MSRNGSARDYGTNPMKHEHGKSPDNKASGRNNHNNGCRTNNHNQTGHIGWNNTQNASYMGTRLHANNYWIYSDSGGHNGNDGYNNVCSEHVWFGCYNNSGACYSRCKSYAYRAHSNDDYEKNTLYLNVGSLNAHDVCQTDAYSVHNAAHLGELVFRGDAHLASHEFQPHKGDKLPTAFAANLNECVTGHNPAYFCS